MTRIVIALGLFLLSISLSTCETVSNNSSTEVPTAETKKSVDSAAKEVVPDNKASPVAENVLEKPAEDLSADAGKTSNASSDENPIVGAIAKDSPRSLGAQKGITKTPENFQCITCESLGESSSNKCVEPLPIYLVSCEENKCYYIVGDLEENGKVVKNAVWAGCGSAPALKLPGQQQAIIHTKHTDGSCRSVAFTHSDLGNTPMSNYTLSFKGHSCNCEQSGCNNAYTKFFSSDSASAKTTMSVFLISFLSIFVAGRHYNNSIL